MLHVFGPTGAQLVAPGHEAALSSDFIWMDCYQPTHEEERMVESALGVDLPTRAEMQEIEVSNRLYQENGFLYMTALMVSRADSAEPESAPVTFIVGPNRIVTIRYSEYLPFRNFIADFQKNPTSFVSPDKVLMGLADRIIERVADVLEKIGFEIEGLSADLFKRQVEDKAPVRTTSKQKHLSLRELIDRIGRAGNLDAKIRESLVSLQRLLTFLNEMRAANFTHESKLHMKSFRADILSLNDHSSFLANKVNFLLDATLGLINIEQNEIIRIFSVVSVMLMPPTLIASVYGMNFENTLEFGWEYGFAFAITCMIVSAILPYLFFKRKGWL